MDFFFCFCSTFYVPKSDDKAGLTLISTNLIRNNVSVNRVENFHVKCLLLNVNTILTNSLKINTSRDRPVSLFRNSQLKFAVPSSYSDWMANKQETTIIRMKWVIPLQCTTIKLKNITHLETKDRGKSF